MSISDRVMTLPRAYSCAALRVAVSGPQAAAHGLDRRPACHCAMRGRLGAGHDNVACPHGANKP